MIMKYTIDINVDYSNGRVEINCPELGLTFGADLQKTIAKSLAIPTSMIADQVKDMLKQLEKDAEA